MNIRTSCALKTVAPFLSALMFLPIAVHAAAPATPPQTLCVTATTKKTNANAVAQMEKDVAPYATNADLAKAIKAYRDELTVAWSAMEEPYCGYGAYGSTSAKKSYGKTVSRARDAFMTAVKNKGAVPVKMATVPVVKPPVTTPAPTTPKPAPAPTTNIILRGLFQGMHSDAVSELQRRLATYFKTSTDADHITGYFGPLTRGLVIKFQIEKNIISTDTDPGAGQIGPRTAAALNTI